MLYHPFTYLSILYEVALLQENSIHYSGRHNDKQNYNDADSQLQKGIFCGLRGMQRSKLVELPQSDGS